MAVSAVLPIVLTFLITRFWTDPLAQAAYDSSRAQATRTSVLDAIGVMSPWVPEAGLKPARDALDAGNLLLIDEPKAALDHYREAAELLKPLCKSAKQSFVETLPTPLDAAPGQERAAWDATLQSLERACGSLAPMY